MGGWESKPENVTEVRFNSEKSCVIHLNKDGLGVHTVSPSPPTLKQKFFYDKTEVAKTFGHEPNEVYICELVHSSSDEFVVVTAVDSTQKFKRIVSVYNETTKSMQIQVAVKEIVLSVRCVKNKLIIVSRYATMIFWYEPSIKKGLSRRLDTRENPNGLCEISLDENILIACVGQVGSEVGSVHLMKLSPEPGFKRNVSESQKIQAHEGELACIALNETGTLLATASEKGTLIRVWVTKTGTKLHEFRRGTEYVTIKSIAFDLNSSLLCCVSNKETGHIFSLKNSDQNTHSVFAGASAILGDYVHYVESEWALSKFQVPVDTVRTCAFVSDKHIMVFCKDGSYRKYELDMETKECLSIECRNIFDGDLCT